MYGFVAFFIMAIVMAAASASVPVVTQIMGGIL